MQIGKQLFKLNNKKNQKKTLKNQFSNFLIHKMKLKTPKINFVSVKINFQGLD